ncbi:hypothetical protein BH24CHL1_BH24CHL1_06620 [soil metagenome]
MVRTGDRFGHPWAGGPIVADQRGVVAKADGCVSPTGAAGPVARTKGEIPGEMSEAALYSGWMDD